MIIKDEQDHEFSGASPRALEYFVQSAHQLRCQSREAAQPRGGAARRALLRAA
jgi:hypothetical protein